ncbi:MAG TPA: cation:proton antiporter [Candidatus Binataceae bacterium]|nr:cation:proton antiporter [Candidatus Binataceae bacterium]
MSAYPHYMVLFVAQNFLEDMALVICVGAAAIYLCQLLHQPVVVGYLIAGIVVGPNTPGLFVNVDRLQLVSDLGVILLVFSIGLGFKSRQLMRLAPTAGLVAVIQLVAMICLGYVVGRLGGWTPWQSLLAGAAISISGAVVAAKAFEEVTVESRVRELVFGIALCEDVIAILLLAVLITLANGGKGSLHAFSMTAGFLGLFIIALMTIGLFTVPQAMRGVARFKRRETLLMTSLAMCFALATVAERAGYAVALGAFLAGSMVAESGMGAEVEALIEPLKDMFSAIFFVSVGMLVDPHQLVRHWHALVALLAAVIAGKIIVVSLACLLIGERPNIASKSGFAMAQIGAVFSILIAQVGGSGSANFLYSLAVGISAITAFLSPYLIRASNPAAAWIDRHLPASVEGAVDQYGGWLERIRTRAGSDS